MTALKDAVKAPCEINMGLEVSTAGDARANGEEEGAVGAARGQVRTIKSALGGNYGT